VQQSTSAQRNMEGTLCLHTTAAFVTWAARCWLRRWLEKQSAGVYQSFSFLAREREEEEDTVSTGKLRQLIATALACAVRKSGVLPNMQAFSVSNKEARCRVLAVRFFNPDLFKQDFQDAAEEAFSNTAPSGLRLWCSTKVSHFLFTAAVVAAAGQVG
jgi:hypothetical protein